MDATACFQSSCNSTMLKAVGEMVDTGGDFYPLRRFVAKCRPSNAERTQSAVGFAAAKLAGTDRRGVS